MQRTIKLSNLEIGFGLFTVISVLITLLPLEDVIILLTLIFIAMKINKPPEPLYQLAMRYVDKITHKQRFNFFGKEIVMDKSIKITRKMLEDMFRKALDEED